MLELIFSSRWSVLALFLVGLLMCSFGSMGTFLAKGPGHFLTISGYLLGFLALITVMIQMFKLKVPFLGAPQNALLVILAIICLKVIIGRLSFLLPGN